MTSSFPRTGSLYDLNQVANATRKHKAAGTLPPLNQYDTCSVAAHSRHLNRAAAPRPDSTSLYDLSAARPATRR